MKKFLLITMVTFSLVTINACTHIKACCAEKSSTESNVCSKCGGTSCSKTCAAGK